MIHLGNKRLQSFILVIAILLPLLLAIANLLFQNLILWYDPARDLLSAVDNLRKPTLIGPTSGIPGLFYGPYWIWLLSFGLLFSKNPLIVTFIIATIPYCLFFPWIWFKFDKYFDRTSLILGWLLFMFSTGIVYATQLWNPYPAPFITLFAIYFLLTLNLAQKTRKQLFREVLTGFLIGLLINFHISFGIAFLLGVVIFLVIYTIVLLLKSEKSKRRPIFFTILSSTGLMACGLLFAFLPTLYFESRHGFHQIATLLDTFTKFGGVVITQGLSKPILIQIFFATFAQLIHLPTNFGEFILAILIVTIVIFGIQKKITFKENEVKVLILIISLFAGVLLIYFNARNPIWKYHFIGVDILFLLLLTFFSSKFPMFRKILIIIAFFSIGMTIFSFAQNAKSPSTLQQQKNVVKIISTDANDTNYAVYAYSPSIYIYEYSYLFYWLAHKNIPYDPGTPIPTPTIIYLIVPSKMDSNVNDFINFRSKPKNYKVVKIWYTSDLVTIIKNVEK